MDISTEERKKILAEKSRLYRINNPEKRKQTVAKYREKNLEKVRARVREWREKNPDKELARKLQWAKDNPEKVKESYRKTCQKNKDKINAYHREKNKALRSSVLTDFYKKDNKWFYDEAKRLTKETGIKYVVDHIMPLIGENFRGLHVPWNLQIITFEANAKKSNRIAI